jgi:hypothetical protein
MKVRAPQPRLTAQLNLPLLTGSASVVPGDRQADLVLALMELLLGAADAAAGKVSDGGDNECETHR